MDAARGSSGRGRRIAVALTLVALVVPALATGAAAPTRDEYVARLEGICKPKALATQRAMKGARADLSAERLAVAAGKFGRASTIFGATVKRMSAVPIPPADAVKLGKWFAYLHRQEDYLQRIVADLRADRATPAQRLTARFIHNGNLANNVVLDFGFEYCAFKFSRYG